MSLIVSFLSLALIIDYCKNEYGNKQFKKSTYKRKTCLVSNTLLI